MNWSRRGNFAFETTLAAKFYAKWLRTLQTEGYRVHLIFLWLESAELAASRVKARVAGGGHDIPEETIKRRYTRGVENFFRLYRPLADSWHLIDASTPEPCEIAKGDKIDGTLIVNRGLWEQIGK
jgi:predicted ABC-type ATPase